MSTSSLSLAPFAPARPAPASTPASAPAPTSTPTSTSTPTPTHKIAPTPEPAPELLRLVAAPEALRQAPLALPATPRGRGGVVAAMAVLHLGLLAALLQSHAVRERLREAAPVFLAVVPAPPPPATRTLPPPPRPTPTPPALAVPVIAPTPIADPAPQAIAATPPALPTPAPVVQAEAPPAPPAPPPRTLPSAAVQYLVPPSPVYSRASARMKEAGRVVLRVWIDEGGMPRDVQVATSSGFPRLDDSALAAVRLARFKPYVESGSAIAGWAVIPIEFELPK